MSGNLFDKFLTFRFRWEKKIFFDNKYKSWKRYI